MKASFGAEARRDTADVTHDLANQPWYNNYFPSYGLDYAGKVSVLEGYGEVNVPVFKDAPLAKYLEFDGAIRETRNKNEDETTGSATLGKTVTHNILSWKLSSIWDLTDWFRLRATRSRDVRAAGFRELYESYAVSAGGPFGTITNPVNQQSQVVATALRAATSISSLKKADTTTVGFVSRAEVGGRSSGRVHVLLRTGIGSCSMIRSPGRRFCARGVQNIVETCVPRGSRRSAIASASGRPVTSAPSRRSTTPR